MKAASLKAKFFFGPLRNASVAFGRLRAARSALFHFTAASSRATRIREAEGSCIVPSCAPRALVCARYAPHRPAPPRRVHCQSNADKKRTVFGRALLWVPQAGTAHGARHGTAGGTLYPRAVVVHFKRTACLLQSREQGHAKGASCHTGGIRLGARRAHAKEERTARRPVYGPAWFTPRTRRGNCFRNLLCTTHAESPLISRKVEEKL